MTYARIWPQLGLCFLGACGTQVSVSEGPALEGKSQAALSVVKPNDPYFSDQWQLQSAGPFTTKDGKGKIGGSDHAHVADAWALILDLGLADGVADIGKDVTLGVIDDGFDLKHEEISEKVVASKNFGGKVESGNLFSNQTPSNFHGMLVTGIAAAQGDNGKGLAGACPGCKLVLARIADDAGKSQGKTPEDYYDECFDWVVAQGAQVINSSWGPEPTASKARLNALVERVTGEAREGLGVSLVFASGNSGEDFAWNSFAASDLTISVGGTDSQGKRYDFSNFGAGLDLTAPTSGAEKMSAGLGSTYVDRIWSTDNYIAPTCLSAGEKPSSGCSDTAGWNPTKPAAGGDGWVGKYSYRFSHTSAAAPIVSGVVGLILHTNPMLTSAEVRDILRHTADKVSNGSAAYDANGFSNRYGFGRVNALRAVAFAHLYGGGEIGDDLRADIDARSPCTRTDCWDLAGAPALPPSDMPDDGGNTGGGSSGGGSGTSGAGTGSNTGSDPTSGGAQTGPDAGQSEGDAGSAAPGEPSEPSESSKSSGCSVSHAAPSRTVGLLTLLGLTALSARRRKRG